MCRPQPGPRCPKHSSARIASHLATRTRIQARIEAATPGTKAYERAIEDLDDINNTLLMDHTDLNSAPSRWEALEGEIDTRFANDPDDPQISQFARSLATGRLLHAERTRQNKLMPTLDRAAASTEAFDAWSELGEARADMARYKVRMDMNGSDYDTWSSWRDRHQEAASRAEIAAARYEAVSADGPSAWREMGEEDKLAARAAVAETADFTTPTAPQPIGEVFNEYADRAEGKPPLIDEELASSLGPDNPDVDIDSTSWAEARARGGNGSAGAPSSTKNQLQLGSTPQKAKEQQTQDQEPAEAQPANQEGSEQAAPRQKTPPGYAGQRARRRRRLMSSRQMWSQVKRGERALDGQGLRKFVEPAQGQGKDPEAAGVLDPTGITFLLSMMSPSRR